MAFPEKEPQRGGQVCISSNPRAQPRRKRMQGSRSSNQKVVSASSCSHTSVLGKPLSNSLHSKSVNQSYKPYITFTVSQARTTEKMETSSTYNYGFQRRYRLGDALDSSPRFRSSLQVALFYKDGRPVDGMGVGRKVLDRVRKPYYSELGGKELAKDGEKSLFTVGSLPRNKLEFTVVLEDVTSSRNNGNASPGGHESPNDTDRKRLRCLYQSKIFKVEISFAAKIPMQAIANPLRGQENENSQEALRVSDI